MLSWRNTSAGIALATFVVSVMQPASAGPVGKLVHSLTASAPVQAVLGGGGPATPAGPLLPGASTAKSPATVIFGASNVSAPQTQSAQASEILSAVGDDQITLSPQGGKATTLHIDAAMAQQLRAMARKRVIVTRQSNGAIAVTPAFQEMVGRVTAIDGSHVTLRALQGNSVTITLPKRGAASLSLRAGSVVTALTHDGGATMTLFVVAASGRHGPADIYFVGRPISLVGNTLSLLTADGIIHTLSCGTCNARLLTTLVRNARSAIYAEVSPRDVLLRFAPIVDGTRIAGTVIGFEDSSLALLTGASDVLMLACTCTASSGVFSDGTPVLVNLNAVGQVVRAWRYPKQRRVVGRVIAVSAHGVTLRFSDQREMRFYCKCMRGRIGNLRLSPGMEISGALGPEGNLTAAWLLAFAPGDYVADGCSIDSGTLINVRVSDAQTELPIYHVQVSLMGRYGTTWLTSQDGTVEFDGAPPGAYRLSVSKRGFLATTTKPFELACHRGLNVAFTISPLHVNPHQKTMPGHAYLRDHLIAVRSGPRSTCRFISNRRTASSKRFLCSIGST